MAADLHLLTLAIVPRAVGEGKDGVITMTTEGPEQQTLGEVEEMHLAVHAAHYHGIEVLHVSHSAYSPLVDLVREFASESGGLTTVVGA